MTKTNLANHGYLCFLYGMYQKGLTALESHDELLKVTGTEVLTMEQVKEHFEKIKAREFTMNVEQSVPEEPHIFELLAALPICEAFMVHCDLSDRLTLRAVSRTFKDIVEDSPLKLKNLSIGSDSREGYIEADNFKVRYTKVPHAVVISNGKRSELCKRRNDILHYHKTDLRTILSLPKLEIGELKIDDEELHVPNVKWGLMNILENFDGYVKVRRWRTVELSFLLDFDPTFIEVIELINHVDPLAFDLEEIFESPHWRNLKELITNQQIETFDIVENLGHLDYMDFKLQQQDDEVIITSEALVALKDKFLTRPTLQKFEIIPTRNHPVDDPIFITPPEAFLPFRDPSDEKWYHFKYPGSEEQLSVRITYDGILFKGPCYCGDKIEIRYRRPATGEDVEDGNDDDNFIVDSDSDAMED